MRSSLTNLLLGLLWVGIAAAQETAVPLDSLGKLYVIDQGLERKIGLFDDYPGFVEARLYQAADSSYALEIIQEVESQQVRRRLPRTPEDVQSLRVHVTRAVLLRSPQAIYDQRGRGAFLVNSALLAAGFYGWAVPVAADEQDGARAVGGYFFLTAAGVLIPYFTTEQTDISRSQAMMDFYGGSRGIAHGIALYYLTDPQTDSERAPYGWAVIGSVAERLAFGQWARHVKMTEGHAAVIGVGGDAGTALSAILASGHDLWNEDFQSAAGGLVLGGSIAGIVIGDQLAKAGDYSRGDAYVLRGLTWLGAGVPAALGDVVDASGKDVSSMATLGGLAALGVGHRLLRNIEFTSSQGLTVLMVEIAVATMATAVVVTSEEDNSAPYSVAAALGGTAGFALGFSNAQRSSRELPRHSQVEFDFNPMAWWTQHGSSGDARHDHQMRQAVGITYRF